MAKIAPCVTTSLGHLQHFHLDTAITRARNLRCHAPFSKRNVTGGIIRNTLSGSQTREELAETRAGNMHQRPCFRMSLWFWSSTHSRKPLVSTRPLKKGWFRGSFIVSIRDHPTQDELTVVRRRHLALLQVMYGGVSPQLQKSKLALA